jgi:hypothetical protein
MKSTLFCSNKYFLAGIILFLILWISACTPGGDSTPPPSAPTNLTATGSLGNIHLSWSASTGSVGGYNIYRSTDDITFEKINTAIVSATSYDDAISSPDGDGVFYYYKVTATNALESDYSNTVKNIHGTRLDASYSSGFTTAAALSPYVAEESVVVEGGDLTVATGTKLYILDDVTVDIEQSRLFMVRGLLRVLASTTAPAAFTSHLAGGGALTGSQGFRLAIVNAVDYANGSNSGTLIQNTRITNMASWNSSDDNTISINGCKPKLYNLYITASADSAAIMYISSDSGAIIQNCSFTNLYASVWGDQTSTGFQMDHNIFTLGFWDYVLEFVYSSTPPVNDGQIANNTFNGSGNLHLSEMTGGGNIPLDNNYWQQGLPSTLKQNGSNQTPVYTPALSSAPAGVGPTW